MFIKSRDIQFPLFQTEGSGGNTDDSVVNVDDIFEEKEEEKEPEKEEETEEEETEEKEEEEEDKEEDKEQTEVLTRVELKDVTKKFPTLFKEFPELREAFFREQKFTELFATIEEANKVIEDADAYNELASAVMSGNTERLLSEIKENDSKAVKKFATNFLPTLHKMDGDLFLDVVSPVIDSYIKSVYNKGKQANTEEERKQLVNAAMIVRRAIFGGEYKDIEGVSDSIIKKSDKSEEDKKDDEDKNRNLQAKYTALVQEVSNSCYGLLDKEIEKGFPDLKGRAKSMAVKAVKDLVGEEMEKDKAHLERMNRLWQREQRNGFSGTLKSSFTTTFLSKAKTLIPKYRTEVRKDLGLKVSENKIEKEPGRPEAGRRSNSDTKLSADKTKGMTAKEIFNS